MGKYDLEIQQELLSFSTSSVGNLSELQKNIYVSHSELNASLQDNVSKKDVLSYLDEIENSLKRSEHLSILAKIRAIVQKQKSNKEIALSSTSIASGVLEIATTITGLLPREITSRAFQIYRQKNEFYGDIWYNRGAQGICLDMGRKIVRLGSFPLVAQNKTCVSRFTAIICHTKSIMRS